MHFFLDPYHDLNICSFYGDPTQWPQASAMAAPWLVHLMFYIEFRQVVFL